MARRIAVSEVAMAYEADISEAFMGVMSGLSTSRA